MYLIDGKEISKKVKAEVKNEVATLPSQPKLLVILVGDDPASKVYVSSKEKACKLCGIESETICVPADVSQKEVIDIIEKANADPKVNGILLQLPLPNSMDTQTILNKISPEKDVDGLTSINQGKLFMNMDCMVPCTPKGIMRLLKEYNVELAGKNAIVIGRSVLVGKPVAMLLLNQNATVTIAHSKTKNLAEICSNMDIIVAAVGKPKFVTADMVKEGAVVIDVGINRVLGNLVGDVDFYGVESKVSRMTPVPGGVGPMTIACLLENVVECYKKQKGIK